MDKYTVEVFRRNDIGWPIKDMAKLYRAVQEENPVVRAGGDRALSYEYGPDAWCIKVTDSKTKECVGGCIFEYWDEHVDNCLSVLAAMVLPKYRGTEVTHILWRTIRWYALGCQWIATIRYAGKNTYIRKYREIKL